MNFYHHPKQNKERVWKRILLAVFPRLASQETLSTKKSAQNADSWGTASNSVVPACHPIISSIANQEGLSNAKWAVINKEASKKEETSFRSLTTRSLYSKPSWHRNLFSVYSNQNSLSSPLFVDKLNNNKKALVDPAGLAPATSDANPEYLLYNTTGPKPGPSSLYLEKFAEANNGTRSNLAI